MPASTSRGQAATLRLPDGKVFCLMTSGQTIVGRKARHSIAFIADRLLAPLLRSGRRRDMIDTSNAAQISGSADIPPDLLPTILLFERSEDPRARTCSIRNGRSNGSAPARGFLARGLR